MVPPDFRCCFFGEFLTKSANVVFLSSGVRSTSSSSSNTLKQFWMLTVRIAFSGTNPVAPLPAIGHSCPRL